MEDLEWEDGMSVEEKIDAGFKLMMKNFREAFRKLDLQQEEIKGLRLYMGKKFQEIDNRFTNVDARFDRLESKMDGAIQTLHNHDEDIVGLQKAVGCK